MIFEVCGEFLDVFPDQPWVIASDGTFCWIDYGWETPVEQTRYGDVDKISSMIRSKPCMKGLNAASENVVDYSWGYEAVVHSFGTTDVRCDMLVVSMFVGMYICQVAGRNYFCHHFWVVTDCLIKITHEYDVLIVIFRLFDEF